jgi:hypothetical protein
MVMKIKYIKNESEKGAVLITALIFVMIVGISTAGFLKRASNRFRTVRREANSEKAFYLADAGIERGLAIARDQTDPTGAYNQPLIDGGSRSLEQQNIAVTITSDGTNSYLITSRVTIEGMTRKIQAGVQKYPPAYVFDYSYFINNWGWFYGSGITANGDIRSNGRFDLAYNPRVNGDIYAAYEIDDHGYGIRGSGGDPANQHPDSPKLPMPNLQDLTYYENLAKGKNGSVTIDGVLVVNEVFGDVPEESGNIVLIGTPSHPIEINGPVVVRGDVIIKGTIKGQGCIYTGRNIYIAGDISYKNAPPSPRPANDNPSTVDNWVNAHKNKDLVGFAARENIIMGDYTGETGGNWYSDLWLFNMGSEDVGEDGIPDTGDVGENDGIFQSEYEDLDGDGNFDDNYNWADVQTQANIVAYQNVPGDVSDFGDIATNMINRLDGVFYTNHAFAARTGNGVHVNGSIISKDEAIIYRNTLTMNYDERIHSRYRSDPSWLIDLCLPSSQIVKITSWEEVK